MARGRLKALTIRGLRTIADLSLELDGLTVLVGDNGSGKSSILEALEFCRRIGGGDFLTSLNTVHGGLGSLLRRGSEQLVVDVHVELRDPEGPASIAQYRLGLMFHGQQTAVAETFRLVTGDGAAPQVLFRRDGPSAEVRAASGMVALPRETAPRRLRTELLLSELSGPLSPHRAIDGLREVLTAIEVHLPFEVTPSWAARAHQRPSSARGSVLLQPADQLALFGSNLANVFHTLRNERAREHWDATMDFVRMGLGGDIESVNTRADAGGGAIAVALELADQSELLPAHALSDGQLAWLCFVALYRLDSERSLLAFDEPELHMHPELLARVVQLFEDMARTHPVILATHSDVLLDALSEPARAVLVCELEDGATRLRQLDPPTLLRWMERYRGVGHLRSEGYLPALLRESAGERALSSDASP